MIQVNKEGIILSKTSLDFECEGVLNPAVIKDNNEIHLFYRAVAKDNYSTIGYCRLKSPTKVGHRNSEPILYPESDYEKQGLEDPRVVKIEDIFYLSYTAFDGINALGALATSKDLIKWEKHGIVVPQITYEEFKHFIASKGSLNEKYFRYNENQKNHNRPDNQLFLWDKNLVFFPKKINGKICFIHRIKPDIQIVVMIDSIEDLTIAFWETYFLNFDQYILLTPLYEHEISYIGAGCPPIETSEGWLIIYHGVHDSAKGYVYSACAALLDLNHPQKEIARLPYPLFFPEKIWELKGEVNNVCFPTGAILEGDTLYIYYGAADERIAVASLSMKNLLKELLLHTL